MPAEISAFKERLKAMSLDTLREKLGGPARGAAWQRDLAEAEMDERELHDDLPDDGAAAPRRKGGLRLWGALLAGVLIAASCAVIAYAGWQVWTMAP